MEKDRFCGIVCDRDELCRDKMEMGIKYVGRGTGGDSYEP